MRQVKALVKKLVSPAIDSLGVYERRLRSSAGMPDRWTIVMYHRVIADIAADPFSLGMCVQRSHFEEQLRCLRDCFHIIPVKEGVRRLREGEPLPAGALSVSFDDGYLDNLTHAAPVLEALGIPWTLFVVTGDLDRGTMLWWDRVIAAFGSTELAAIDSAAVGLPGPAGRLPLDLGRAPGTVEHVLGQLWSLDHETRLHIIERLEGVLAQRIRDKLVARRLSAAQVQDLHRRGVEIGAHSVLHPNLGLCDDATAMHEMQQSRLELESLLQSPVTGFAYPGGRLAQATPELARRCGFDYALATDVGVNASTSNRYRLMRIGMPDAPLADFRRALSAAMRRGDGAPNLTF